MKKAFTLIEILVVVSIIGILVSLVVGGVAKSRRMVESIPKEAKVINTTTQNQLGKTTKVIITYSMPDGSTWTATTTGRCTWKLDKFEEGTGGPSPADNEKPWLITQ